MAKVKGTAFRFYGNTGSYATPTYTATGGATNCTLNFNMSTIDVTDKDSSGHKETLDGVDDWNVAVTCHYDAGDAVIDQIEADILAHTLCKAEIKTLNSNKWSGDGRYTLMSHGAAHDGAVSLNFTYEGTGELSRAAA